MTSRIIRARAIESIPSAPFTNFLFKDTRAAWIWLPIRLFVAYQWLTAGWSKLTGFSLELGSFGQPVEGGRWIFSSAGQLAMQGFVTGAVKKATGTHPVVQDWYAAFLQHIVLPNAGLFSYLIPFGELLVGLGLLLGILTGIAACFGCLMNLNYLLSGAISTNPMLAILGLLLILAWRIAGYIGLDRYVLPFLGTPWTGSLRRVVKQRAETASLAEG
jgi:thiosulfate dehydrogenase [quinone] large subunit